MGIGSETFWVMYWGSKMKKSLWQKGQILCKVRVGIRCVLMVLSL